MAEQIITDWRVLDASGNPISGARLRFYESGTDTLLTVYADEGLITAHPDPLLSGAGGTVAQVFFNGAVEARLRVFTPTDTLLHDFDPVPTSVTTTGAAQISFSPVTGNAATNVQAAIANNTASILTLAENAENTVRAVLTGGSSNTYTLAAENTISAYAENQGFQIIANHTNTGAATINIDSLGVKDIQKYDAAGSPTALVAGDLVAGGVYDLVYDGTRFMMASPVTASESIPGLVEKATTAEVADGTAGKYADAAQIKTRYGGWNFTSTQQTVTLNGHLTIAHGLGAMPSDFKVFLVCTTDNGGWVVGDRIIPPTGSQIGADHYGVTVGADATNIYISTGSQIQVRNKATTTTFTNLTAGSWRYIAVARA